MKERPILFSAPMVRAILEGRKTQTRRILKDTGLYAIEPHHGAETAARERAALATQCPYGQPGDRLWVRETWRYTAGSLEESRAITEDMTSGVAVDWRATYTDNCMKILGFSREEAEMADDFETWRPSIHMPRWASRILLEITGVRVERLQDISDNDIEVEGTAQWIKNGGNVYAPRPGFDGKYPDETGKVFVKPNRLAFCSLWESINGTGSWDANPWVWVMEFKQLKGGAA